MCSGIVSIETPILAVKLEFLKNAATATIGYAYILLSITLS